VTEPPAPFADLLREPRAEARLRREKLAEAPGLSPRATSDLERVATPHKDTVRLLAEPLHSSLAMPGT
jgi:transcriptional regulator with XRE-family HTH domain